MKTVVKMFAIAALIAAAPAQAATCLQSSMIDRTSVPNEHTILFHMRDGKIWSNHLAVDCPGLKMNGFSYRLQPADQICENLQDIRVQQTDMVCRLGSFTQVPKHV